MKRIICLCRLRLKYRIRFYVLNLMFHEIKWLIQNQSNSGNLEYLLVKENIASIVIRNILHNFIVMKITDKIDCWCVVQRRKLLILRHNCNIGVIFDFSSHVDCVLLSIFIENIFDSNRKITSFGKNICM